VVTVSPSFTPKSTVNPDESDKTTAIFPFFFRVSQELGNPEEKR